MWHEIGCVRVVSLQVMIEMAILTAMACIRLKGASAEMF
jgi:formate hydrogenlyase subunit 4